MKITWNEAEKLNITDKIIDLLGLNPYAINEGLLDPDEILDVEIPTPQKEEHEK